MSENNELVLLQNARTALSQVSTFDDAREIRDKADAVRHYARQAKLGQELVVEAAVLKLRAERRLGEILRETQLATGVEGNQHADIPGEPNGVLLSELGISKSESSRMQRIAELAKEVFETYVRTELESQREPTITGVMRLVRESKPVNAKPVGAPETKCKSVASLDELLRSGQLAGSIDAGQGCIYTAGWLAEKQRQLLEWVDLRGQMRLEELARLLKVSPQMVSDWIYQLVQRGQFKGYANWTQGIIYAAAAHKLGTESACPSCGGQLTPGGGGRIVCQHCGTEAMRAD